MAQKERKIKTRDTGFNIAYRVVTAVIAACTFPTVVFTSLFYLAYTLPLFSLLSGDSTDTGASFFKASIYELVTKYAKYADAFEGNTDLAEKLSVLKGPFTAIVCLYAAVCVLALVIILLAAFTRKKLPIIITSVLGFGVLAGIPFAFKAFEAPILDGTINLDTFLNTGLEGILSMVATVDFVRAGDAYTFLWVIFGAILIWTGAVMLVNIGDEPKDRKASK